MSDKKKPKPAWDDEPTPQTDAQALDRMYFSDQGSLLTATTSEKSEYGDYAPVELARDLERRLRHALKLVNSLRLDALRTDDWTMNAADVEQQSRAIEEVLTP